MPSEVLKKLLECGVHFGHQTRRWNPKMKKFIFGERSGIYIIDLEKTEEYLAKACDFVQSITAKGGKVLFAGTKKQAQDVIASEAVRAEMPYINHRWSGGLLTNFETVCKSLAKLRKIEQMAEDGTLENLKKKEVVSINKTKEKLLRDFGGIREMMEVPNAVFIIDTKREDIAVKESVRLGIPIVGLLDTNCDPDFIDHPIPGNDDALKAIRYISSAIANSAIEGRKLFMEAETIRKRKEDTGKKKDAKKAEAKKETAVEAAAEEK